MVFSLTDTAGTLADDHDFQNGVTGSCFTFRWVYGNGTWETNIELGLAYSLLPSPPRPCCRRLYCLQAYARFYFFLYFLCGMGGHRLRKYEVCVVTAFVLCISYGADLFSLTCFHGSRGYGCERGRKASTCYAIDPLDMSFTMLVCFPS